MAETFVPWARPWFDRQERRYLLEALDSTWISGGSFVDRFEREFAALHGVAHALTTSNGTTALHVAYLALGISPGDEVVVPGFGFLAAANIAWHVGATPVFAEVDPHTWCLGPEGVEPVLSPRTKAIVPVHTYGNVCAMDGILALARERSIAVIEDAAESLGSRYRGRLAGTMGTVGCFSFQVTKTITTGEGGMVITDDPHLADTMFLYRNHGMRRLVYYWHDVHGHNFRLTNLQAALGVAQLENLDRAIKARELLRRTYERYLQDADGLTCQVFPKEVSPVLWAQAVKLDPRAYPQGRDAVIAAMREAGIETRPGFYAPTQMPHLYRSRPLPVCEDLASHVVSLPTYPTLEEETIARVCATLRSLRR